MRSTSIPIAPGYSTCIATTSRLGKPAKSLTITDWDVRWPSADADGQIVYELDGELHVYDSRSDQDRALSIAVPADAMVTRPQAVNAADNIESHAISPGGERLAIVARGDVFTVPVEHGVTRNLTRSSNAHDREVAWSTDGKRLAYISDRSGEEELYIQAQDGTTPAEPVTSGSKARYYWRRDGRPMTSALRLPIRPGRLYVIEIAEQAPHPRRQRSRRCCRSTISGRRTADTSATR